MVKDMAMEHLSFQVVTNILDLIRMTLKMGMAHSYGQMVTTIQGAGYRGSRRDMGNTSTKMETTTKEISMRGSLTALEHILGQMEQNILGIIRRIRELDLALWYTQMVQSFLESGKTEFM